MDCRRPYEVFPFLAIPPQRAEPAGIILAILPECVLAIEDSASLFQMTAACRALVEVTFARLAPHVLHRFHAHADWYALFGVGALPQLVTRRPPDTDYGNTAASQHGEVISLAVVPSVSNDKFRVKPSVRPARLNLADWVIQGSRSGWR